MNSTLTATTEKDAWLAEFNRQEKDLARHGRPAIQRLRRSAIARFDELGFPTARTEDWRFTSVGPLVRTAFQPATPGPHGLAVGRLAHVAGMDAPCRLVFVNGFYSPDLSSLPALPSIKPAVTSMAASIT